MLRAGGLIFIADAKTRRVAYATEPLCAACGLTCAEIKTLGLRELAMKFGASANWDIELADALSQRFERVTSVGMKQAFEMSLALIPDGNIIGSIRDITEELKAASVMEKYAEGLSLLYELSALFLNTRGLKDALQKALEMLRNYYEADFTHVLFPDEDGRNLEVFAGLPTGAQQVIIPISPDFMTGSTYLEQCPVIVLDYGKEQRYKRSEYYSALEVKSGLSVPMSADGRVIGVLCIFYKTPQEIDTAGLWYLNVVSNTLAVYIEKERSVERVGKSEAFLSSVLEGIGEGVVAIDRDFNILSANTSYYAQIKCSASESVGKKCYQLSHHHDEPCYKKGEECAVKKVFDTGKPQRGLHTHIDSDGNAVYVETHAYPIFDAEGNISAAVETITNVTERVRLERDLDKRVRELEDFYEMAVGRELKMIELKEEVATLKAELGKTR